MNLDLISLMEAGARSGVQDMTTQLPPLLMWGDFIFQLSTLAYNKLTLSEGWSWASQARFGRTDTLQYTGKKAPTLRFDCELYDDFVNTTGLSELVEPLGVWQDANNDPVEWLRHQANTHTPLMLVTGYGRVMGFWVLEQLDQAIDEFRGAGHFRHQTVTLAMRFYGNSLSGTDDDPAEVETASAQDASASVAEMQAFLSENDSV
ncbi:phage tail protein [Klebsiella aerogenes]|uniref:phage tail protein n=1 Tax=Klebsiella aerogenes TaxID=548 RepID=UPI002E30C61E|nr:phage tail protein [Klebsiella aerogenes]